MSWTLQLIKRQDHQLGGSSCIVLLHIDYMYLENQGLGALERRAGSEKKGPWIEFVSESVKGPRRRKVISWLEERSWKWGRFWRSESCVEMNAVGCPGTLAGDVQDWRLQEVAQQEPAWFSAWPSQTSRELPADEASCDLVMWREWVTVMDNQVE